MAMLPEFYPVGAGGDPLEEYLRTLAQMGDPTDVYPRAISPFTRPQAIPSFGAIPGTQYNDYLGADPTRSLRLSSFRKNYPKSLRVDNPGATLPAEPSPSLEEDPITVLRRNTDRVRNYPRESSEMFSPSFNPEGDIINFRRMNTDRARNYQRDRDYLPGKQTPPRDTSSLPKTPAVKTTGLLDTEEPAEGGSFYDDPMSMGLIQAGLGLMSAPRYSTNPNDVTLGSALARGLGGFVQGYGGTKKRLSEAERQKLEDEYRKSERDFNKMYKEVMMDDAKSRIDERRGNYSATVREKLEEKNLIDTMVNEVLAAEGKIDNKTRKINLTTLARQDRDRFNELHQNATTDRAPFEQILIESGEYDAESAAGLPLSILKDTAKTIAAQRIKPEKPEGGLFGDSLQAKAAQYLIDEQGADPQQLAERIMEGRSTPQVVSVPVDPNDPTKGSRLMLLDRNNLAMDEIPGGTTVPPKKEINATDIRNYNDYQITLNQIDQSIGLLKDEEAIKGVGTIQGYYPGIAIPAKAKQLRALMADLTSDRLNEKFGAALTKQEFDRIKAAVPLETDTEETLQVKLNTLKDIFQNKLGLLEQQYPSSRYRPFPNINAVGLDGYNEAIGN